MHYNHLVKVTLAKKPEKMNRLINVLKLYSKRKGYSRPFSKELRHCGSFLGRDYKQLIQILPIVIAALFTDPEEDKDIILVNKPLKKLSTLCSLIFVRQVESHFNVYVDKVSEATKELIKEVHDFDKTIKNKTPYSCKPKMHLIRHLKDDLLQFGCALHYETEKGEQFNKLLREHLFHTNKKDTSRDLALKFGKQEVLRHIINGGSWKSKKNGKRVKYGIELEKCILSLGDDFFNNMFGESREFSDNNYAGIKTIKVGVCGVFQQETNSNKIMYVHR